MTTPPPEPRPDISGIIVMSIFAMALIMGLISQAIYAAEQRRRAEYWREIALDCADRLPVEQAEAVYLAAERER